MNADIFRQYDIRGIVDRDLTPSVVEKIGRAFGSVLAENGGTTVAVGHDCRLSSPKLAEALIDGLTAAGASVIELGMVPTPVLYFSAARLKTDGAVQITGSHNPPEYNGLKLVLNGKSVYGDAISELHGRIERGEFHEGLGSRVKQADPVGQYVNWVVENAEMGPIPVKIVVDCGNGAAGPTILPLLRRLNVEFVPMYAEPDGTFPNHHPDPTILANLEALRAKVQETGADFGVGFDGDADRIGVIDKQGDVLWGDKLMIIFARDILKDNPGATIVGEVKCSQTMFDDIEAHGGVAVMWKVGHSLIKAKMGELGALLAGEMSGHIFFQHRYFGFDDALYATTRLAEMVSREGRSLADHLCDVPTTFVTPEIRIEVESDDIKFKAAQAVAESYQVSPLGGIRDIVTLDGVRVIFEDGWGLVRASNTQPVLVLRAEATTEAQRDFIEADLRARVDSAVSQLKNP